MKLVSLLNLYRLWHQSFVIFTAVLEFVWPQFDCNRIARWVVQTFLYHYVNILLNFLRVLTNFYLKGNFKRKNPKQSLSFLKRHQIASFCLSRDYTYSWACFRRGVSDAMSSFLSFDSTQIKRSRKTVRKLILKSFCLLKYFEKVCTSPYDYVHWHIFMPWKWNGPNHGCVIFALKAAYSLFTRAVAKEPCMVIRSRMYIRTCADSMRGGMSINSQINCLRWVAARLEIQTLMLSMFQQETRMYL